MAVRNESVRLSLDDDFTSGMARAAAMTALLNRELKDLHGTSVKAGRGLSETSVSTDRMLASMRRGGAEIDKFSGRLRLILDAVAILGPALVPIGAIAVPAVAGLATVLAAAGTAGAGALIAFQGVGDAVTKLQEARLNPTVESLEAAREAMEAIGPQAREFVVAFQDLRPVLKDIRDASAEGLFPGLTDSLDSFEELAPKLERIFRRVGAATGDAASDGMESLTTERWRPFFNFIAREMPTAVTDLAKIVGDLTHGAAQMWMAFDPGNDAFVGWLGDVADGFDKWASSAKGREDIAAFLEYVRETGPLVQDAFAGIVDAFAQIAQAAAPIGGVVLQALTGVANVVATIADSDLGTPLIAGIAALSAYNRVLAVTTSLQTKMAASNSGFLGGFVSNRVDGMKSLRTDLQGVAKDAKTLGSTWATLGPKTALVSDASKSLRTNVGGLAREFGKVAGPAAGLGLVMSGAAEGMGGASTASLALMGGMVGGVPGALAGGLVGAFLDVRAQGKGVADTIRQIESAMNSSSSGVKEWGQAFVTATAALDAAKVDPHEVTGFGDALADSLAGWKSVLGGSGTADADKLGEITAATNARLVEMDGILSGVNDRLGGTAFGIGEIVTESGMVENVNFSLEDMNRVATQLQPAMTALGYSLNDLTDPEKVNEIVTYTRTFDDAAPKAERLGAAVSGLTNDLLTNAQAAGVLQDALAALTTGLDASRAADSFRASLLSVKDDMDGLAKTLKGDAGIGARGLVGDQFEALNAQLVAMAADGAGPKRIAAVLREGAESIVDFGVAAGLSEPQLRAFLKQVGLTPAMVRTVFEAAGVDLATAKAKEALRAFNSLPKNVRTDVKENGIPQTMAKVDALVAKYKLTEEERQALITLMDHASPGIRGIIALIDKVRDKSVTITTNHVTNRSNSAPGTGGQELDDVTVATGGHIRGPGTSTSDSIPAMLSDNEFVEPAVAVDHYGVAFMEAVRTRRFPKPEGFAGGGMVGQTHASSLNSGIGSAASSMGIGGASSMTGLFHATEFAGNALHTLGQFALEDVKDRRRELRIDIKLSEKWRDAREDDLRDSIEYRDKIRDAMDTLADSLSTRGAVDVFGEASSASAVLGAIATNTATATQLTDAIGKLEDAGFSKKALNALLENGEFETIIRISRFAPADLLRIGNSFMAMQSAQHQLGVVGGQAVFGSTLANANADVAADRKELIEANSNLRGLQKALDKADKRYDRMEKRQEKLLTATRETGPDRTARGVGREIRGVSVGAQLRAGRAGKK